MLNSPDSFMRVSLIILFIVCMCVVCGGMCARACTDVVRRQLLGVGSLLPPCGSWEPNSGHPVGGKCFSLLRLFYNEVLNDSHNLLNTENGVQDGYTGSLPHCHTLKTSGTLSSNEGLSCLCT